MPVDNLPTRTLMGAVTLLAASPDTLIDYYHRGVGLDVLQTTESGAILGKPGQPSLVIERGDGLRHGADSAAGLFHTAFLFPTESELAAAVYSVARHFPSSFTGSSDHLVSKALYFDDPEGNGVELYWDRPRSEWSWTEDGIAMGTKYLDPNEFLQTNLTADGAVSSASGLSSVGHVHLKVGDIDVAKEFYVDAVGFDITARFGGQALFVSAGGYHHHLGMNTWQSGGAGPRTPALGLGQVSISVPGSDDIGALTERLAARGVATRFDGEVLRFDDPWRNSVTVTPGAPIH